MNSASALLRLAVATSMLILLDNASIAQNSPITRTELQRNTLSNISGQQGVMYKAVIVPGGKAPKHTHPGDEFLYVLKGTLIVEAEGKAPLTLNAGDSLYQMKGMPHTARNGSTTEPVEALVFLIVGYGMPLATNLE
jgi:quercetin dioxygenase-like cupin family protein